MIPNVFLSSTCYDLNQVRKDITTFIQSQGFSARDSTNPTQFFPKPGMDIHRSCFEEIASCELFVLVVGGRYGEVISDTNRSITNEEYLVAYKLGIPIFTFVQKNVWDLLQLWKIDPKKDYKPFVEDNHVFNFIESIRNQSRDNWMWPFEYADDIIKTLRHQWASYFSHLIKITRGKEFLRCRPSRQDLMSNYCRLLDSTVDSFDILGASLVTVARSAGLSKIFNTLSKKKIKGRILVLDATSDCAKWRAQEEYGESNLLDELRSSQPLWRQLIYKNNSISARLYKKHPKYFIFRIDKHYYVSFYPYDDSSVNAPTFEFDESSPNASFFQSQFDMLWKDGEPL